MTDRLYTIGQAARRTGLSVRRLRFYADEGLLPPAGRTAAGYRVFSDADLVRISLIRALRDAGVGLEAIREALGRRRSVADVLALRLAEIEAQIERQQRIVAVLRAALRAPDPTDPENLRRIWTMTSLSAAACNAAIEGFIAEVAVAGDIDSAWQERTARLSRVELPAEPTAAQIDAWIELQGMLADPAFVERMRANARDSNVGPLDAEIFAEVQDAILPAARQALADGVAAGSMKGREVARQYLEGWARALGVAADDDYWARMKRKHLEHKPETDRYWRLIHTIGGMKAMSAPDPAWLWIGESADRLLAEM